MPKFQYRLRSLLIAVTVCGVIAAIVRVLGIKFVFVVGYALLVLLLPIVTMHIMRVRRVAIAVAVGFICSLLLHFALLYTSQVELEEFLWPLKAIWEQNENKQSSENIPGLGERIKELDLGFGRIFLVPLVFLANSMVIGSLCGWFVFLCSKVMSEIRNGLDENDISNQ